MNDLILSIWKRILFTGVIGFDGGNDVAVVVRPLWRILIRVEHIAVRF